MLGCLESPYLDSKMFRCLVSPLNGCSGSIRPALGGAVTPPCPSSPQLVFGWHLLSDLSSVGFYSSRALKCRVCRRLWVRPAVGQVRPGWSRSSPWRVLADAIRNLAKLWTLFPRKRRNTQHRTSHIFLGRRPRPQGTGSQAAHEGPLEKGCVP